jgi:polyisoprenyl-phosphate glycosyltransferase
MRIDIVVPTFQNAKGLPLLVAEIEKWASERHIDCKLLLVDDCSVDNTNEVLRKLKLDSKLKIQSIRMSANYGQYTATAVGLGLSSADWIVTMDDDLQHHPSEIDKLLEKAKTEHFDLVYGYFTTKKHSFFRNLGTKTLQIALKWTGQDYTNVTAFRLISGKIGRQFKGIRQSVHFLEEPLMSRASKVGFQPVMHFQRSVGASNYSGWKLAGMALQILIYHSSFPLKLMSRVGIFLAFVCFILGIIFVVKKLTGTVELGYTSIIVSIFFSTGLILTSLSIIGSYLRKIWLNGQSFEQVSWDYDE